MKVAAWWGGGGRVVWQYHGHGKTMGKVTSKESKDD